MRFKQYVKELKANTAATLETVRGLLTDVAAITELMGDLGKPSTENLIILANVYVGATDEVKQHIIKFLNPNPDDFWNPRRTPNYIESYLKKDGLFSAEKRCIEFCNLFWTNQTLFQLLSDNEPLFGRLIYFIHNHDDRKSRPDDVLQYFGFYRNWEETSLTGFIEQLPNPPWTVLYMLYDHDTRETVLGVNKKMALNMLRHSLARKETPHRSLSVAPNSFNDCLRRIHLSYQRLEERARNAAWEAEDAKEHPEKYTDKKARKPPVVAEPQRLSLTEVLELFPRGKSLTEIFNTTEVASFCDPSELETQQFCKTFSETKYEGLKDGIKAQLASRNFILFLHVFHNALSIPASFPAVIAGYFNKQYEAEITALTAEDKIKMFNLLIEEGFDKHCKAINTEFMDKFLDSFASMPPLALEALSDKAFMHLYSYRNSFVQLIEASAGDEFATLNLRKESLLGSTPMIKQIAKLQLEIQTLKANKAVQKQQIGQLQQAKSALEKQVTILAAEKQQLSEQVQNLQNQQSKWGGHTSVGAPAAKPGAHQERELQEVVTATVRSEL